MQSTLHQHRKRCNIWCHLRVEIWEHALRKDSLLRLVYWWHYSTIVLRYLSITSQSSHTIIRDGWFKGKLEPWFHRVAIIFAIVIGITGLIMTQFNHDGLGVVGVANGIISEGFTVPCRGHGVALFCCVNTEVLLHGYRLFCCNFIYTHFLVSVWLRFRSFLSSAFACSVLFTSVFTFTFTLASTLASTFAVSPLASSASFGLDHHYRITMRSSSSWSTTQIYNTTISIFTGEVSK